jgi:nickel-dependent lactate racemase
MNMKIELHYGKGRVSLDIPQENIAEVIRPWNRERTTDNNTVIKRALTEKNITDFWEKAAGKRICVLLSDGTRDMLFEDIFGALFEMLKDYSQVLFLICTGTHNADTAENKRIIGQIETAGKRTGRKNFQIHVHDCFNDKLISAGKTTSGTEVSYNAKAKDADIFLVLSDVKCHYFGGYSNPVKNFMPGICAFNTAEQNHSFALDERSTFGIHPWHADENRRNNPLACDQLEGMRLITGDRNVYALVTISSSGKIQWARFGPAEKVSREAFGISDERSMHSVKPVDRLIVSPGGFPNDIDLYIAQRALELTRAAVKDNGEVLFLAECSKGIGEEHTMENFYNRLTLPLEEIFESIKDKYKLFSHKPYKFARMIQRLRKIWVHSEINDELIEAAHLYSAHDPQKIVDNWLREHPDAKITLVDGANKIALYAE